MKRYKLGLEDKYNIACIGTKAMECPCSKIVLDEEIDETKLRNAVKNAFRYLPYFKCRVVFEEGDYFLEEIEDSDFPIFNTPFESRQKTFGKTTNGYPFKLTWYKNTLYFEFLHAISDGKGVDLFLTKILQSYFGVPTGENRDDYDKDPTLEILYDKSEKGMNIKPQAKGYNAKDFPFTDENFVTCCHEISAPFSSILKYSKSADATPATVLAPMFAMAVRKHIKDGVNKNILTNIVVDVRKPFGVTTLHNFIDTVPITYTDRFDKLSMDTICTAYRAILDLALQPENIVRSATKKLNDMKLLFISKSRNVQYLIALTMVKLMRNHEENVNLTYVGRTAFGEEVSKHILNFNIMAWPDFGQCNIAMMDHDGILKMCICENYNDKGVVDTFIEICNQNGIPLKEEKRYNYQQSVFEL